MVRLPAVIATIIGSATIMVTVIFVPKIYNEISSTWNELDEDMVEFRVLSNDLWSEMISMARASGKRRIRRQYSQGQGSGYPSGGGDPGYPSGGGGRYTSTPPPGPRGWNNNYDGTTRSPNSRINPGPFGQNDNPGGAPPGVRPPNSIETSRERERIGAGPNIAGDFIDIPPPDIQEPICQCNAENRCPVGERGPPGPPGNDGFAGPNGIGAPNGHDAGDVQLLRKTEGCFYCPNGIQGPPGVDGAPGADGMTGALGQYGLSGRDGRPGLSGRRGGIGLNGGVGFEGTQGPPGQDSRKPVGRPGPRGNRGVNGLAGDIGNTGYESLIGPPGVPGIMGVLGRIGTSGKDGNVGHQGLAGEAGRDALYCACPKRDIALQFDQNQIGSKKTKKA